MHPSIQHGICTDYCFITEWNQVVMKKSWDSTRQKQWIKVLLSRLFESHGFLHFVLSVFIYMKCYFIQDFIVIKSSKKTQLQFVNCRAHATHRNAVSQAFGSNWKQNSWVDVGLPKFTCATFNGVGRIGTFPNCTHFFQSKASQLFILVIWHSLLRNGERVAFFSHQFYQLGCDLVFSSSFKVEIF